MLGAPFADSESPARRPGRFSYDRSVEEWQWDDEVYRIHGHEPGAIVPTLDVILECVDPAEREVVASVLHRVLLAAEAGGISYRLLAADGAERRVVLVVGATKRAPNDPVVDGYYVDLTTGVAGASPGHGPATAPSEDSRTTVEWAKRAVMLAYEVDSEAAVVMLRWWSRQRMVTVRDLSSRLADVIQRWDLGEEPDAAGLRTAIDTLLLELSDRVDPPPDGGADPWP